MSHIVRPTLRGHSSTFTKLDHRGSQDALSRLETKVQDVSIQQDDLSEARQQVLIDRQRVASSAREIQRFRHNAAGREARLMDIFRKHYTDIGDSFPEDLILAYSDVEHSRKELTAAEDAHDKMERSLEIAEWSLIEQENDLYQLMLPTLLHEEYDIIEEPSPTADVSPWDPSCEVPHTLEHQPAYRDRYDARSSGPQLFGDKWSFKKQEFLDSMPLFSGETYAPLLHRELKSHNGQFQTTVLYTNGPHNDWDRSVSTIGGGLPHRSIITPHERQQTASTGSLLPAEEDLKTKSSVSDWILTYLRMNATEKLCLVAILRAEIGESSDGDLNFDKWSETVQQFWTKDDTASLDASNSETSHSDTVSELPIFVNEDLPHLIQANVERNLSSFGLHDWFLSNAHDIDPYTPRNAELEMMVPQIQAEDMPVGKYGIIDLEDKTDYRQTERPTSVTGVQPSLPLLQVTNPDDEIITKEIPGDHSGRLSPMDNFRIRWDSIHNSETDKEQSLPENLARAEHDHHGMEESSSANFSLAQAQHEIEPKKVQDSGEESDGVVYSAWAWSEDLQLFYRNGTYQGDEVVESMWLRYQDARSMWNHRGRPKERIVTDLNSCGYAAFSYDSPRLSSVETSQRNSEIDGCNDFEKTAQPSSFKGRIRARSWRPLPSLDYINDALSERLWRDKNFERVHPAHCSEFFKIGRIFEVLSCGPRRDSLGASTQSSRDSSPRPWSDDTWSASGLFVVIINHGGSSLCARIEPIREPHHCFPYQDLNSYGRIEISAGPHRPRSNDILRDLVLRVHLKDGTGCLLPVGARIDYAIMHNISHDRRFIEIGSVVEEDLQWLKMRFQEIFSLSSSNDSISPVWT